MSNPQGNNAAEGQGQQLNDNPGDAAAQAVLDAAKAGQGQPGQGEPPKPDDPPRPDGQNEIPEQFRGKTPEETAQKLFTAWKGFRDKEAARGPTPQDAAGYAFQPGEELAGFMGEAKVTDDPAFKLASEIALKHGIPAKAMAELTEGVMLQSIKAITGGDWTAQSEFADLAGSKDAVAIDAAKPRFIEANAFVMNVVERAKLDKATAAEAASFAASAAGVRFVEALRKMTGATGPVPGDNPGGVPSITREDLRARLADPRNDPAHPSFSRAFRTETDRLYKQLFPTGG